MELFSYEKIVKSSKLKLAKILNNYLNLSTNSNCTASISQVHKAKTFENDIVAVKILRPGVEKAIFSDLSFLNGVQIFEFFG